MFLTIVVFILVIGLLIFVHEFGHFITAKRAGIKVEEFGFGFPPRVFGVKRGETIYSLNLLPIGGFVKIYGEEGKPDKETEEGAKRAFYNKPIRTRAFILVAGVTMNLILAAFLFSLGHWLGLPSVIDDQATNPGARVQIVQVAFNSPASQAEIKMGDVIKELSLGQERLVVSQVNQVQKFINNYRGQEIKVVVQRGDEILEKTLVPRSEPPADEGPLGIALVRTAIVSYPWYQALVRGVVGTFNLIWVMAAAFGGLFWQLLTTGHLVEEIAGPVGIFALTGQAVEHGFIYVLQFTILLSVILAVINILPFPALDGGRLLFLAIEKIKGSPVNQKIERITHLVGFVILILLMVVVTWRDIGRFF